MAGKRKVRQLKRRNPLAPIARQMGRRIKPSAKRYKRRLKHPEGGAGESGSGNSDPG